MNTKRIIDEISKQYPGKDILVEEENGYVEIVVELEPTAEHPERSVALAVVGRSKPHFHKVTTEVYEVTHGILTLYINGETFMLKKGEKMTIAPGQVHYAESDEAWFLTYSTPGWTPADHILYTERKEE